MIQMDRSPIGNVSALFKKAPKARDKKEFITPPAGRETL